jgi:chromosome segregation ATPase
MDKITREVNEIEATLHTSRTQLQTLERNAQNSISSEVNSIRTSLKSSDKRIEYVASQTRHFLSQIEYFNEAETCVDVQPQMTWLRDNLQSIVADLSTAEEQADSAIETTKDYSYKVMDIGQEVESNSSRLSEFHAQATSLAEQAQAALSASESMLEYTEDQIRKKEVEIKEKTAEAAAKRERKIELEVNIEKKRKEIETAEQNRKSRKEDSILGVVSHSFGEVKGSSY